MGRQAKIRINSALLGLFQCGGRRLARIKNARRGTVFDRIATLIGTRKSVHSVKPIAFSLDSKGFTVQPHSVEPALKRHAVLVRNKRAIRDNRALKSICLAKLARDRKASSIGIAWKINKNGLQLGKLRGKGRQIHIILKANFIAFIGGNESFHIHHIIKMSRAFNMAVTNKNVFCVGAKWFHKAPP